MTRTIPIAALTALACCGAWAQPAAETPAFEVASVQPAQQTMGPNMSMQAWMRGGPGSADPGRIDYHNLTVTTLITKAYGIADWQISGPEWTRRERFDIVAKVPRGATKEQFNQMLANLLKERFKLEFHRETRELPVYWLTVAKGGPKLHPHVDAAQPAVEDKPRAPGPLKVDAEGYPVVTAQFGNATMGGKTSWRMANSSLEKLGTLIATELKAPMKDATGLQGKYDLELHWVTQSNYRVSGHPPDIGDGPDIFAALRAQMGLNLEKKQGPAEFLVIDHMEKVPTEN